MNKEAVKVQVKKGQDYNRTKVQKILSAITDGNMMFKGDYEIELTVIKKQDLKKNKISSKKPLGFFEDSNNIADNMLEEVKSYELS